MLGHIAFAGFVAVWNPWAGTRWSPERRALLAGLAGGGCVLFDYSGAVLLAGLGAYVLIRRWRAGAAAAARSALVYALGAAGPIVLLWLYQWRAFGHPFLPGQHWMPPVEWIERGYQGYQLPPDPALLWALLLDHRFGLFLAGPLFLLALAAPFVDRGVSRPLPALELATALGVAAGLWLFFGGSNYTRLQFNTGIRYLAPAFPFLFAPAAVVLARMRAGARYAWVLLALVVSWPLAMYRDVETPLGLLDPIVRTFTGGFALPALTALGRTTGQYGEFFANGVSPLPLFVAAGAVIYGLWSPRLRERGGPGPSRGSRGGSRP
jgi:hypothetical protein